MLRSPHAHCERPRSSGPATLTWTITNPATLRILSLSKDEECPLAWLRSDRQSRFLNMPTVFGPVDLTAELDKTGKTLEVTYAQHFHAKPAKWDGKAESIPI